MVTDYPDWTQLAHIVGCDVTVGIEIEAQAIDLDTNITGAEIMVPIDLQGAYIMMPVDIQAQYVTIDINIAASAVTLNVAIQSSAVTLNVNLSSSSITLNVNISSITGGVTFNIGTVSGTVNVNLQSSSITLNVQSPAGTTIRCDIVAETITHLDVHLTTCTLTLNVNLTSQSVTINVNLSSSSITLNVNLQSSSITLNVNIASSAATINVNLTSQSVNINIDIEAQSVGMYLQPDWQTKEGAGKDFNVDLTNIAIGSVAYGSYTVTAGKTLYITHIGFSIWAYDAANRNNNQIGELEIINWTDTAILQYLGGNGGGGLAFTKPLKIVGGKVVRWYGINHANHAVNIDISVNGYEV